MREFDQVDGESSCLELGKGNSSDFVRLGDSSLYIILVKCQTAHIAHDLQQYRRNFRGLKFSRISLAQTFRDLIFEDCVRATYVNRTIGKILDDKFSRFVIVPRKPRKF